MLDELRDMMVERLLLYEKKNKVLPARIFVYRDGVSEVRCDLLYVYIESDTNIISLLYRANLIRSWRRNCPKSWTHSRS
jgi:hypothetical protein